MVAAHAFNPSTWEAEAGRFEFKASLVYKVSSGTARATEKPCLKNKQTNKQTYKQKPKTKPNQKLKST